MTYSLKRYIMLVILTATVLLVTTGVVSADGIAGKKICIDPGHGANTGAVWKDESGEVKFREDYINLEVALDLKELLISEGAVPVLTRDTNINPSHKNRWQTSQNNNCEIFIAIHCDSNDKTKPSGTQVYYYPPENTDAGALAKTLANEIYGKVTSDLKTKGDRAVPIQDAIGTRSIVVLDASRYSAKQIPAVNVELGFISNSDDRQKLVSQDGQKKAATAILHGIQLYYGDAPQEQPSPNLPASLSQYNSDELTEIPLGGTTTENSVIMKGVVLDPNGDKVQLEVEVKPLGTAFTGTPTKTSSLVASGSTASVTCTGLSNGQYHWQARAKNSAGVTGSWLSAGGNSEDKPDFIVKPVTPTRDTIRVYRTATGQIDVLDIETEYLPYVVAAENGGAPFESMKAQAVASRTFAYYKIKNPRGSNFDLYDDERDQVYNPNKVLNKNHKKAVSETNGVTLRYDRDIICSFYVKGTGDTAPYVTYNEGKSGDSIYQTSLGWITKPPSSNPYNRGCMGQVQANELASKGYDWIRVLKYFYGEDIILTKTQNDSPEDPVEILSDGFDFPVGAPDGKGYKHGTVNDKNGWDFLEYNKNKKIFHPGEDWNGIDDSGNPVGNADFGDLVYAISNGRVIYASLDSNAWGNIILIEHRLQDGTTVWSQYAHLKDMLVSSGDVVQRGQKIGTIGKDDGVAHLHFEIRKKLLKPGAWDVSSKTKVLENYHDPSDFINSHRPQTEMDEAKGNANVMLVIDRSGSMSGTPISNAKNSAKQFIDQMGSEDKAGVVSFCSYASKNYPLTTLTDNERKLIKNEIGLISTWDTTAIGKGLELALYELQDNGDKNSHKAIVLLSDGYQNSGKHPYDVISSFQKTQNKDIKVYTIGLGNYVDVDLLEKIAEMTGGKYYSSREEGYLNQIYNDIGAKILDLDTANKLTVNMVTNDVLSIPVKIDSSIEKASFGVSWPGSNVDLVLYKPDGSLVDPSIADSDPTIEYLSGPTYKIYKVTDPEPGMWNMELNATDMPAGGEDVYVTVRAESTLSMLLSTDKDQYNQGEIVKIITSLSDAGTQITGADVNVNITLPDSSIKQITLYDNGGNGDGEAKDGVYANYFVDTSLMGDYKVDATSTGSLPDGSQFTRINDTSFEIISGTSSISLSPEHLPLDGKAGGLITENVTVSTSQTSTLVTITPTLLQSENGDVIDTSNIKVDPTTVNVSAGVPENILITIDVPESAVSGNYTGKIVATGVGGGDSCTVNLHVTKGVVTDNVVAPVINSVDLYPANPTPGSVIAVTVNATDDVGVNSVKANDISLLNQGGNLWTGDITALEGTHSVNVSAVDEAGNIAWDNSISYTALKPGNLPPSSINLQSTKGTTWINWTWTNPTDPDFFYYEIYLDGVFQTNTSAEYFNSTGLEPETSYTIGMRTVDINGNISQIWANETVITKKEFVLGIEFPVANFNTNVSGGHTPLSVQFNDRSENAFSLNWSFGDGTSSTEKNPIHTYSTAGVYTVKLTVSNENGIDSKLATINVLETEGKKICDKTNKVCKSVCEENDPVCELVCEETKPTCKETKPACKERKPICKETKPICKEIKPICKEIKPICKEIKPICKESKPTCKETKPTCKETNPVCKEVKLVCKETKPTCKETKEMNKEAEKVSEEAEEVSGGTKQVSEEAEEVSEEAEEVSEGTKQVSEEAEEVSEDAEEVSEDAEEVSEGTKQVSEDAEEVSEGTKQVSEEAEEASEDTKQVSEEAKEASEDTKQVSEEAEEVSEDAEEVSEDAEEVSEDAEEVSEEASEEASEETNEVNQNIEKV
ncbi:N-acetylmuramoyl-L-alanine amidase [Methanosarcina sp. 1.H.A.2.2]|uniref:N-acetylmuramoyl-L-alanine amidase n=1 Tax=Methanosarcina sp. 1.H.A.2.2 TaxID=1483601 RepID=UPI0006213540|nr:N-acetylmuramoyl-L-alanine amidase [Methanosarcina sp. 1.H.A.2.2]KKH48881.1 hypothetical protein EO93_17100 [Methanosarcina sp. 1.H.A.2.2]